MKVKLFVFAMFIAMAGGFRNSPNRAGLKKATFLPGSNGDFPSRNIDVNIAKLCAQLDTDGHKPNALDALVRKFEFHRREFNDFQKRVTPFLVAINIFNLCVIAKSVYNIFNLLRREPLV